MSPRNMSFELFFGSSSNNEYVTDMASLKKFNHLCHSRNLRCLYSYIFFRLCNSYEPCFKFASKFWFFPTGYNILTWTILGHWCLNYAFPWCMLLFSALHSPVSVFSFTEKFKLFPAVLLLIPVFTALFSPACNRHCPLLYSKVWILMFSSKS